jgi:tRNA pseudouridine13 synthase
MRLKTTPDEFLVREATDLRIRKEPAPYRVYQLEKSDWNTADALMRIAQERRVAYTKFAYGGKKDRHAHTFQYVTVESPIDLSHKTKGYDFQALGYSTEPMGPAHILSNHFELTLREMLDSEVAKLQANETQIKEYGIPNYFDDQRFGNLDKERGLIAEKMLLGRWDEALNLALTSIYSEEHREAKERKRALREHWGDWDRCRSLARTGLEQRSFDLLQTNPNAFKEALATANRELLTMWASTYQSFLWNEVMRRYLTEHGWVRCSAPGAAGPYLFQTDAARLHDQLVIPLPGRAMRFPQPDIGLILEQVLQERRLRPASLEKELLPGLIMNASPRNGLLVPHNLTIEPPTPDERYPGKSKVQVRFSLQRGSYATMIIKGLLT